MFGRFDVINSRVFATRSEALRHNGTMIGTGLTMEGFSDAYLTQELMSEMSWRRRPVNRDIWVTLYIRRRYGQSHVAAERAWRRLATHVFNAKFSGNFRGKVLLHKASKDFLFPEKESLKLILNR